MRERAWNSGEARPDNRWGGKSEARGGADEQTINKNK